MPVLIFKFGGFCTSRALYQTLSLLAKAVWLDETIRVPALSAPAISWAV